MTRIALATTGSVALAGCSDSSGSSGSATSSGQTQQSSTPTTADSSTEKPAADVGSVEAEAKSELDGVELVDHRIYAEDGAVNVDGTVKVTDAAAVERDIMLEAKIEFAKGLGHRTDVDVLSEFESGKSYTLTAQFFDVKPERISAYELTVVQSPEAPQN